MTILIKNSKNGSIFFINLLDFYALRRPHNHHVPTELVECVYPCFPGQINEIQQNIKNASILKFIIFPEEFPINESEQQKEMFLILQKDDTDEFISFLSKNTS